MQAVNGGQSDFPRLESLLLYIELKNIWHLVYKLSIFASKLI